MSEKPSGGNTYGAARLRVVFICLVIWALASFGIAILLRPVTSNIAMGGVDLGFWFAQQGSILVVLVLVLFYVWRMNSLDKQFEADEE